MTQVDLPPPIKDRTARKQTSRTIRQYEIFIKDTQWPIIYSPHYNISFFGLEKIHPFDSQKWQHIFKMLEDAGMVKEESVIQPMEASQDELLMVHTKDYLNSLKCSFNVAKITEVPPVAFLPNVIVQPRLLRPLRYQTSGTILAFKLALERGWAINIGGGFHHCSSNRGGGFCAYADITLSIKYGFDNFEEVKKVMIIDLDAHQGNGHEMDFMDDQRVYIMDIYNKDIYPHDVTAKRAIKRKIEVQSHINNEQYLKAVEKHTEGALNEFMPDLVVYNAGTDVLLGDPLGNMDITVQGVVKRDEIVFSKCKSREIPIFMLTSGGYSADSANAVASSILNLRSNRLISHETAQDTFLDGKHGDNNAKF